MDEEITLDQYKEMFNRLGKDVPFGTACIIFVQGMACGGNPFARKILEMYAQDEPEEIKDGEFVYSVKYQPKANP